MPTTTNAELCSQLNEDHFSTQIRKKTREHLTDAQCNEEQTMSTKRSRLSMMILTQTICTVYLCLFAHTHIYNNELLT